jgi:S1-C subfamily serine protease
VTCDYIVEGQVVVEDARWYLGMKGLLLPGKGIGIEDVANGSPAASVGLLPGMVITRCNGVDLVDETALQNVIENSGGVLKMDLLLSDETPATCVVVMQRVASQSY